MSRILVNGSLGFPGIFGGRGIGEYYDRIANIIYCYLVEGASSAGPGARLCRARTPFGGVIENF